MADPKRPSLQFGGVFFGSDSPAPPRPVDPQVPFRILVLANFSGRETSALSLKSIKVDRDNFDEVLSQVAPRLENFMHTSDGAPQTLSFQELEHFGPDHLYETLNLFEQFRSVRRRLMKPNTFSAAAAEVRGWLGKTAPAPIQPTASVAPLITGTLLEQSLDLTQQEMAAHSGGIDVERMVRDIIRPYLEEKPDPQQGELVATVDALQAQLMRTVLHHPAFQRLEAAWRGLQLLVRRLETDANLQVFIMDVSKSAILADLTSVSDLRQSKLSKALVDNTVGVAGGLPWSVILGDYEFGATEEDALLAGCLANIASRAGAPLIAAGRTELFGCQKIERSLEPNDWQQPLSKEVAQAWGAIRQRPEAAYLGLVSPRVLLRYPYDEESSRLEVIPFNEIIDGDHASYLWGNGGWIAAILLGESYSAHGVRFTLGTINEVRGLPLHVYKEDGEQVMKPCAEGLILDRGVEKIIAAGLMPLVSVKNQDAVRLMSFCSTSQNGHPLAGRWK